MAFFTSAVTGLKTVVTAIGAGVAVWGVINLLEGYGNDNPGAKSQGVIFFTTTNSLSYPTIVYCLYCFYDFISIFFCTIHSQIYLR